MKYKVTLPEVDDTCKGGKCNHVHEHIVDNEPPKPKIEAYTPPTPAPAAAPTPAPAAAPGTAPGHEGHNHNPKPDAFNHATIAQQMPSAINFGKCSGGNCGDKIKNAKINTSFKKCTNCGDNSNPKKAKFCKTCGKDEPQDDEEKADFWEESDIDTDVIEDDED